MAPKDTYLLVFTHFVQSPLPECRQPSDLLLKNRIRQKRWMSLLKFGNSCCSLSLSPVLLACSNGASRYGCPALCGVPHSQQGQPETESCQHSPQWAWNLILPGRVLRWKQPWPSPWHSLERDPEPEYQAKLPSDSCPTKTVR